MTVPETSKPIGLVVMIDDETFDQHIYKRILERSGLVERSLSFLGADLALEYFLAHPEEQIDAIFLDINMPRMDGFEFLEAATKTLGPNFAKVCIVMLTTSLDDNDRTRAMSFDIVRDFLNKPLTLEDVQRVADIIRAERAGR